MIITLLTDFGVQDTFVGVLKGVLKSLAPGVDVVDLTHNIPRQDIVAGAFALKTANRYFPTNTVHLNIVDPGVGSARRPIAARIGDYFYVCPDNGLLSYVLAEDTLHQAVTLDKTEYHLPHVSRTFHGRDIFAPVAAHLSRGVPLMTLGTPLMTLETFSLSRPHVSGDVLTCHVVYFDVYGNVFTDLTEDIYDTWHTGPVHIDVRGQRIPGPLTSYSDAALGRPLALFGSSGHLEIAVRNGSAQTHFGLSRGDAVTLHL